MPRPVVGREPPVIYLLHLLLMTAYAAAPVVAVGRVVWLRRHHRPTAARLAARRARRAVAGGLVAGLVVCAAYALSATLGAGHATRPVDTAGVLRAVATVRPSVAQVLVTAYWAAAFILLLGHLDRGLWRVTQALFRLRPVRGGGYRVTLPQLTGALLFRVGVVFVGVIPYVLAVALTYRPRMAPATDPGRLYRWAFEPVTFPATDGSRVAGWWIPAAGGATDRTVIVCPGETGGAAAALPLVTDLRDHGYNLLVFDFRGHGESGGQLVSYGDAERRDVLGAVRWLRQDRPAAAVRVMGLGVSTGAAALLAAAADSSPWGQSIDAVAVYAPYDRLDRLVTTAVSPYAPAPFAWLARHVGLPLAGVQVGAPLARFSPAVAAAEIWPRPVLVVLGMDDDVIPFAAGQAVYDAAAQPKQGLFIDKCSHAELLDDAAARRAVVLWFDLARSVI